VQLYDKARVAPNIQSFGGTDGRIFEFPRITHPSAVPKVKFRVAPNPIVVKLRRLSSLRVAPNSASTAGSMMNPRQSSNFRSPACAEDESSRYLGSCTFLPDPGCILNLIRPFTAACASGERPYSTALCIVLSG